MFYRRFTALFVLMLISCSVLYGQYRVSGRVFAADGKEVSQGLIKIVELESATSLITTGYFEIADVAAGRYTLEISVIGFTPQIYPLHVVNKDIKLSIALNPVYRQIETVIVNSRMLSSPDKDNTLNSETVHPSHISRYMGGSLMQTLSRLPGVHMIGIGAGQSKPLVRGMGFNRVVTIEKGIKHEGQQWGADHGLEIDQFATGEIDVIRGGASFLYGSDAIGGVIDVKTKTYPEIQTSGGTVDLIGKSNNMLWGTSAHLYHRKTTWFYEGRVTYQNYGDYRVPADTVYVYSYAVPLYQQHLRNTAGKELNFHLNSGYVNGRFSSVLYFSNNFIKSGFFANAHGLEPRRVDTDLHDRSARDIQMPCQQVNHLKLIHRSEYTVGKHHFETDLGFQHNFRQEFSPYVNHGYMPPLYPEDLDISRDLEREFDKKVYSANFRDKFTLKSHVVTIGASGEYQDNLIDGWTFLMPAFRQSSAGLFVYDKFSLNEKLSLHGAVRYDHSTIRTVSYTDWFPSLIETDGEQQLEELTRAEALRRNFNSFVWSLGLGYKLDRLSVQANVGKSFRVPIAKELAANGVNYHYFSYELGNPDLAPEQSYQGEVILRWQNSHFTIQLSPYYNYFSNYIYLNPTPDFDHYYGAGNQVFVYTQSEVSRYGAEIQAKYDISKSLSTEILGEYLYARQLSGQKKGYTLPFSPPASVLINLTWSPLGSNKLQSPYFGVDYKRVATQNNIVPPEKKTRGYAIWHVQAGGQFAFAGRSVQLSLQVQNVLNTTYMDHTNFYRLIELPEAARNVVLSLRMPFHFQKV